MFFGREKIISQIHADLKALKDTKRDLALIGERRIGKTSLLLNLPFYYAVKNAIYNAKKNKISNARFICGDLYKPINGQKFDLIYANPPYVPTAPDWIEKDIIETAWNAGTDGRKFLDRIIAGANKHLTPKGRIVVVQSSLANIPETINSLEDNNFQTQILAEKKERLGPISMGRYKWLESQGLLIDALYEKLVVIEGKK